MYGVYVIWHVEGFIGSLRRRRKVVQYYVLHTYRPHRHFPAINTRHVRAFYPLDWRVSHNESVYVLFLSYLLNNPYPSQLTSAFNFF
jgi:hypothetical protein